jgi:hypothetical protein
VLILGPTKGLVRSIFSNLEYPSSLEGKLKLEGALLELEKLEELLELELELEEPPPSSSSYVIDIPDPSSSSVILVG